jgi:hydrogenase-4 component F
MTYHTFAKPVAFFSAGALAQLHRSSDFDAIGSGTLGRTPMASSLLLLAAMFITGSPPFSLFFSEMIILRAGFLGPHVVATSVFLAALVVIFCGFAYQIGRLVLGTRPTQNGGTSPDPETLDFGLGTTLVAAGLAVVSTFYLPGPMVALIRAATDVVSRGL